MACRGIFQLKKIHLQFCDYGGSSRGTREFLQSTYLKDFIAKNPQVEFKFMRRRGTHPFITATYVNGYIKDQTLRNYDPVEILNELTRARNSFGRSHLRHAGKKVYGNIKSIQGGWRANLWNNYPKFQFEETHIFTEPSKELEAIPFDAEAEARKRRIKDDVNELFKEKSQQYKSVPK